MTQAAQSSNGGAGHSDASGTRRGILSPGASGSSSMGGGGATRNNMNQMGVIRHMDECLVQDQINEESSFLEHSRTDINQSNHEEGEAILGSGHGMGAGSNTDRPGGLTQNNMSQRQTYR